MPDDTVAGLTPDQWQEHLDAISEDPDALATQLAALEQEMRQENTWVHDNPTPGPIFKAIFRFLKRRDDDLEQLGAKIHSELHAERRLKERYRGWLPGEQAADRLFPFLKDFGGEVQPEAGGLQFEGFAKYKGLKRGSKVEVFAFYLNERFPGRDPANFHLSFTPADGELVIARVYKMELPRAAGESAARAVLAELIGDIAPDPGAIHKLVVDNAANLETRQALLALDRSDGSVRYSIKAGADPARTPLGHLMLRLAAELGLAAGELSARVDRFGVLKITLPVERP